MRVAQQLSHMDLPLLQFNQFIQKKVGNQLTANLNIDLVFLSLVYSSTNKGRTGKSYTSVVHGLHASQLLLCPTENCIVRKCRQFHCVNFSKQLCWFKKKMNQCDVPDTFLTSCFLTRGHKLLSLISRLPQLSSTLFCHANIREGNFFESQNKQRAYLLHVRKMQNVCFI